VIILGIDPGTARLGYGVVERTGQRLRAIDYGVISTSSEETLPRRLETIYGSLTDLIELHNPGIVAVERLFFTKNVQTAFAVGQARGVVLLAAALRSIDVQEATPNEVKVATAGHGSAEKEQVQRMVQAILGLPEVPEPDDAADALAIAICIAHRERSVGHMPTGALDRSAINPAERGVTSYEKAVREALRRERVEAGAKAKQPRTGGSKAAS
jgi:crossover junction endodeoxyribonuclease RuvC